MVPTKNIRPELETVGASKYPVLVTLADASVVNGLFIVDLGNASLIIDICNGLFIQVSSKIHLSFAMWHYVACRIKGIELLGLGG